MTKGICSFAKQLPIAPGSNDPRITPRVAILHVDAGNASSLYTYFRDRSGGIEAHFFVRKDGVIEQYRNIFWQADANHKANDFAVSIETQGYGAGTWNAAQLASIKKLLLWLRSEAGIPLVKCPKWNGSGIGYHIQFGSPGYWTPVSKSCPGPDRIKQFNSVLVPWMREQGSNTAARTENEEESPLSWNEQVSYWYPGDKDPKDTMRAGQQLNQARGYAQGAYSAAVRAEAAVKALAKALGPQVEKSVAEALKDATVNVDVNIAKGVDD